MSADSMDIARGIGERDGKAFSDRPKTGVSDDPGFDPPLSFDARQSQLARMTVPCALASFRRLERISAFHPIAEIRTGTLTQATEEVGDENNPGPPLHFYQLG
jgi:hypothetical protein